MKLFVLMMACIGLLAGATDYVLTSGPELTFTPNGDSIDNSTDGEFDFTRDESGAVTIVVSDDDANASLLISAGGTGASTFGISTGSAATIDAGTGDLTVDAATGIIMTQAATECMYLSAADITCDTSDGCSDPADLILTNFDTTMAAFGGATGASDAYGSWVFSVPNNISGTTLTATIYWESDDASCGGAAGDEVCWTVSTNGIAHDASFFSATTGTSQGAEATCTAQGDLQVTAVADAITHGWVDQEIAIVEIMRDVDAGHEDCAADAFDDDANLLGVEICYEADNAFSGE